MLRGGQRLLQRRGRDAPAAGASSRSPCRWTKVRAAIAAIEEDTWTPIKYPNAIFDEQLGGWVSDAEVAETFYTAFT